ncbi:e9imm peptide [Streptomyces sp. NPDC098789]|uniref:e9imm peptide n=1 Tax=Streptomyces sp. NPDC098789 TaxID=3366098 RepID=UPI00382B5F2F
MTREEAIHLVQQILDGTLTTESEVDAALESLHVGLRCPHIANYIYWDFDPDLTAEKVVNRALSYEPIAL